MKRFLPFALMICAAHCDASYLTTRSDATTFYADPQCSVAAETGIAPGNTYYFNENNQPQADAVMFEFGDATVYAKRADVDIFTDEEFAAAGPDEASGFDREQSQPWRMRPWVKWVIFLAIAWLLYKFVYKRFISRLPDSAPVPAPAPAEPEPAAPKYGEGSEGYTAAFCHNLDFKPRLKELNRLAALNPGKNTTDAEALRNYLIELQPALKQFLREAAGERQFTADPRFRDANELNAAGEGGAEWLYVQLRGKEYVDPLRLLELDPLKFEIYVSENLSRHLKSDRDRQLHERRLKKSLAHVDDYDNADRVRIYSMLWDLKRESDPREAYGYICKAVELGHTPYPKEKMEKKYGTDGNGSLTIGTYKRKRAVKWAVGIVAALAVVAALLVLALYVALAAFFAFCLYMTFKLMISDATNRNRPTPTKNAIQESAGAYTCGCCKRFDTPACPRWSEGVSSSDPECGMVEKS